MNYILLLLIIGFSFSTSAQETLTKLRGSYNSLTGYTLDQDHNLYNFGVVNASEAENITILPGATQSTYGGGSNDVYIEKRSQEGEVLWNTFIGGEGHENISLKINSNGIYIVGSTTSQENISTEGAFQENFKIYDNTVNMSPNRFIIKLSDDGTKEWGTYFRSTSNDIVEGINDSQIDENGNIYIVGNTASAEGIATPGSIDSERGQAYQKGFIVKFDSNGNREWGTYYGTSSRTGGFNALNSIDVDNDGNIVVSGNSALATPTSYFITDGAYNDNQNTGFEDVIMAKFDSDGNRLWGFIYGGIEIERNLDIAIDSQNNILWAGITESTADIASPGAYQEVLGSSNPINGQNDLFLAKFNSNGNRVWSTYYGGRQEDFSGFNAGYNGASRHILAFNENDEIYVSGLTKSEEQIATQGTFQDNLASVDSLDAYVAKFDTAGNRLWGTYFGGQGEESNISILYDQNQEFYLFGLTGSANGIATSNGWWESSMQGNPSGFVVKFEEEDLSLGKSDLQNLKVFPNPSNGSFTIAGNKDRVLDLFIYDLNGRLVKKASKVQTNTVLNYRSELESGIYFLKIESQNANFETFKLVIQ